MDCIITILSCYGNLSFIITYYKPMHNIICYLGSPAGGKQSDGAHGGFDPVAELMKLRQSQKSRCSLEIGELLRVRGPVKTSRQQREIMASTFCEWRRLYLLHLEAEMAV